MYESYTVGVKSRFPWFRRYKSVIGHSNEPMNDETRLVIRFKDNSLLAIPQIGRKHVKIYSDFAPYEQERKAKEEAAKIKDISHGDVGI